MALIDSQSSAWDAKMHYNFWRPITAIPAGAAHGNPRTVADPTWLPLLPSTPPHPEYFSGHCAGSGAAAVVLADVFGSDQMAFTIATSSSSPGGAARSFASFTAAEEEVEMARLTGGIHFPTSNRLGLRIGERIGRHAVRHFLRPVRDCDHGDRDRDRDRDRGDRWPDLGDDD